MYVCMYVCMYGATIPCASVFIGPALALPGPALALPGPALARVDARAGLAIPEALPCGRRVATSASWPCPAPPLRALLVISNARTRAPARTAHDDFPKNFPGNVAYATMRMGCAVAHCAQFPSSTRRKIQKKTWSSESILVPGYEPSRRGLGAKRGRGDQVH